MEHSNQTFETRFILLGLSNIPHLQALFFLLFLLMYIITLSGNSMLIVVVRIDARLQTPMYFFLSNLSVIDICLSSTIVPKILINTLAKDRSISILGCALQMYFHLALGATECIILAAMAFDRYAAICYPLHYNTIMNKTFCVGMASGSWTVIFLISVMHIVFTFQLPFCRSHHVDHFFCEMPPFFPLSCRDTWFNELAMYISTGIVAMCSFCLTLISYIHIISTILKIKSSQGRHKAFSTCASHLTVVSLYYGTIIFMYICPRSTHSPQTDKTVSIIYTAVTPMLNPIIYSMRNKEVKGTIKNKLAKQMLP
ncbi:olfactory receptor 5V1-like [Discoglossus pictus]